MARRNLSPAEIGDIVRTTRRAASLRQDELAGAAGVGLRFIVDLEAGKALLQFAGMVVDRAERCAHSTRGNGLPTSR